MTVDDRRLWEIEHPYFCAESEGTAIGHQHISRLEHYDTWHDFTQTIRYNSGYRDENLLVRWDWHTEPDQPAHDDLGLQFLHQRKGEFWSVFVDVQRSDEPAVRAWLTECAVVMRETWEPFLDAPQLTPKEA